MSKIQNHKRKNSLRLKHFDYSTSTAYFITICTKEGRSVFLDRELAEATIELLKKRKKHDQYKIYTYCLMPDHLHVLLNPADSGIPIPRFIQTFKSQSGFWYKKQYGKTLWQRGFYDHVVRKNEDLMKIAQYILNNPIRKQIVQNIDEYPYSEIYDELE